MTSSIQKKKNSLMTEHNEHRSHICQTSAQPIFTYLKTSQTNHQKRRSPPRILSKGCPQFNQSRDNLFISPNGGAILPQVDFMRNIKHNLECISAPLDSPVSRKHPAASEKLTQKQSYNYSTALSHHIIIDEEKKYIYLDCAHPSTHPHQFFLAPYHI
jgi:hypothetical protein